MKRIVQFCAVAALLLGFVVLLACEKHQEKPTLSPQAAHMQVSDSVMTLVGKGQITTEKQFNAARNKLATGIIAKVSSDSLQGESLISYGQLLAWSGNERKGRDVLEGLRKGKDKFAPMAWKELITLDIEGNEYGKAEAMLSEYRKTFPPDTSDLQYLFNQCSSLSDRYGEANQPEAAIRVCMDELNTVPPNAPYSSFYLVGSLASLMMETGRTDELRRILDTHRAKMQTELALHEKNAPADSAERAKDAIGEGLKGLISVFSSLSSQLDLIGKKAPAFKFLHVYNADSTFTLEKLQGKVVMLDFWATWCLPCVVGYAEAGRIYRDYRDKGFDILGITSLQGSYRDRDTGVKEGTKDKPLDRGREIELTESYVKKHKMIWPCAISDRSVIDPSYSIKGIPTFVLLDRGGIVRFIQMGIGQEKQKRRVIDRLIKG
jgi:thiol-disulfide isomerase/thioredoxin